MTPTITLLKSIYSSYIDFFDNWTNESGRKLRRMPEPAFEISHARSYLGQYSCKSVAVNRFTTRKKHTIKISDAFDYEEQLLHDVVIHEMIHYFISYNELKTTSPHGPLFKSVMKEINTNAGRNIRISYRTPSATSSATPPSPSSDSSPANLSSLKGKIRTHLICRFTDEEGKECYTFVPQNQLFYWERDLKKALPMVTDFRFYVTRNPIFNQYVHPRKISAYYVSDAFRKDFDSDKYMRHLVRMENSFVTGSHVNVAP